MFFWFWGVWRGPQCNLLALTINFLRKKQALIFMMCTCPPFGPPENRSNKQLVWGPLSGSILGANGPQLPNRPQGPVFVLISIPGNLTNRCFFNHSKWLVLVLNSTPPARTHHITHHITPQHNTTSQHNTLQHITLDT